MKAHGLDLPVYIRRKTLSWAFENWNSPQKMTSHTPWLEYAYISIYMYIYFRSRGHSRALITRPRTLKDTFKVHITHLSKKTSILPKLGSYSCKYLPHRNLTAIARKKKTQTSESKMNLKIYIKLYLITFLALNDCYMTTEVMTTVSGGVRGTFVIWLEHWKVALHITLLVFGNLITENIHLMRKYK